MSNSDIIKRAECLIEAYREALPLIPSAIYQETGYQLGQVIQGFIPALLQTLAVLGISMVAGAGAGAVIGFFLGGVGVAPGAVVGGQLGLDMGAVILTWLGLAFLVESIGRGLGVWFRPWTTRFGSHGLRQIETAPGIITSIKPPTDWRAAWAFCSA